MSPERLKELAREATGGCTQPFETCPQCAPMLELAYRVAYEQRKEDREIAMDAMAGIVAWPVGRIRTALYNLPSEPPR